MTNKSNIIITTPRQLNRDAIVRGIFDKLALAMEFYEDIEDDDKAMEAHDLWTVAKAPCSCRKYNLFSNENIRAARATLATYADDLAAYAESAKMVNRLLSDIDAYLAQ